MNKQYDKWQDVVTDFSTDKYDDDFKKIGELNWLPWVGKNYDSTRIFILGASHYGKKESYTEEDQYIEETVESKKFTRKIVAEHGIDLKNIRDKKYAFAAFNKCLLNEKALHSKDRGELWNSVSFYNLLQVVMKKGTKTIATNTEKETAWKAFKKLVPILKPKICIAWGVSILYYWANNYGEFTGQYIRQEKISGCYPRESIITIDGHEISICVIKHPCQYFSHKKWREYLLTQHKNKLQRIISE